MVIRDIKDKIINGMVVKEEEIKLNIERIFIWKIEKKVVVDKKDDEGRDNKIVKIYKKEISINGYFFYKIVKKEEKVVEVSDEDFDDSFEKKVVRGWCLKEVGVFNLF